jgi:hypothetical protein
MSVGCRETGHILEDPEGGGYPSAHGGSSAPQCAERTGHSINGGRVALATSSPPCNLGDGGAQHEHTHAALGNAHGTQAQQIVCKSLLR